MQTSPRVEALDFRGFRFFDGGITRNAFPWEFDPGERNPVYTPPTNPWEMLPKLATKLALYSIMRV